MADINLIHSMVDHLSHTEERERRIYNEVLKLFGSKAKPPTIVLYSSVGDGKFEPPKYLSAAQAIFLDSRSFLDGYERLGGLISLRGLNIQNPTHEIYAVIVFTFNERLSHEYSHHVMYDLYPEQKREELATQLSQLANKFPKKSDTKDFKSTFYDLLYAKEEVIADWVACRLSLVSPPLTDYEQSHYRFTSRANGYIRFVVSYIQELRRSIITEENFSEFVETFLSATDTDIKSTKIAIKLARGKMNETT